MDGPFTNLNRSKQERIINAALEEFAKHGYDQASTNRIVKNAGIGKGMLFYYFKSKEELYYYLINVCLDLIINEYLCFIDETESDFIERYRQAAQLKIKALAERPYVFHFIGAVFLNDDDLPESLQKRLEEFSQLGYQKMYSNINTSLFRDDVDLERVMKLLHWFMEGYEKEIVQKLKGETLSDVDSAPYFEDFFAYLDTLKICFYKQND